MKMSIQYTYATLKNKNRLVMERLKLFYSQHSKTQIHNSHFKHNNYEIF